MKRIFFATLLCLAAQTSFSAASLVGTTVTTSGATIARTPASAGNLLLLFIATTTGAGSPWPTATGHDTQGLSWSGLLGTEGTSADSFTGLHITSCLYAYAASTASESITVSFNGGTPSSVKMWIVEITGMAASTPILTNIHNYQTSVGTGSNAVTTAGGVGSDVVSSASLLIGWFDASTSTVNAGTTLGWTQSDGGFNAARLVEYYAAPSANTYDATATMSATANVTSWMLAISNATSSGPPPSQFFLGAREKNVRDARGRGGIEVSERYVTRGMRDGRRLIFVPEPVSLITRGDESRKNSIGMILPVRRVER